MFRQRISILSLIYSLVFLLMIGRLIDLQIIHSDEYKNQGENKRTRLVQIPPVRGKIVDITGKTIAEDRRSYGLWLIPAGIKKIDGKRTTVSFLGENISPSRLIRAATSKGSRHEFHKKLILQDLESGELVARLAKLLKINKEEVALKIFKSATGRQARDEHDLLAPRPCFNSVDFKTFLTVKSEREDQFGGNLFSAIDPRLGAKRIYSGGKSMGHITGYVGNLSKEEYITLRGPLGSGRSSRRRRRACLPRRV